MRDSFAIRSRRTPSARLSSLVARLGLIRAESDGRVHKFGSTAHFLVARAQAGEPFALWIRPKRVRVQGTSPVLRIAAGAGKLIASRDGLGICPLFYASGRGGAFSLSSEPSWLSWLLGPPRPNLTRLTRYLAGFDDLDNSSADWVEGVSRLPPGSTLVVEPGREPRVRAWFNARCERETEHKRIGFYTPERLIARLDRRTREGPHDLLMSAGVDSTLLAAVGAVRGTIRRAFVFSQPEFPKACEWNEARSFACELGLAATPIPLRASAIGPDRAPPSPWLGPLTSPGWEPEAFGLAQIRARQGGYGALLSGVGADELLGGGARVLTRYRALRGRAAGRPLKELTRATCYHVWARRPDTLQRAQHRRALLASYPHWLSTEHAEIEELAERSRFMAKAMAHWKGVRHRRLAQLTSWRWEGVTRGMQRHRRAIAPLRWETPFLDERLWIELADCPPTLSLALWPDGWRDKALARRAHDLLGSPSKIAWSSKRDAMSELFIARTRSTSLHGGELCASGIIQDESIFQALYQRAFIRKDIKALIHLWRVYAAHNWLRALAASVTVQPPLRV